MKKENSFPSKFRITGTKSVVIAIGGIIPIIICAYLVIRCIRPGAGRTENVAAAIFTILSLCFLAIALVKEIVINLRLVGPLRELKQAKSNLERRVEKRTRELAETKDFLESIIRSMTDMLMVVDGDDRIKEVNQACEKLLGHSREDLRGKKVGNVVSEFSSENTDEARVVSKGGEEIPVSIKRSSLYDKDGRETGSLIIARDIRDRLATENKMREASRMSALGQFAAGAAHEINNPLSIISSNAQYLIEKLMDVERSDGGITRGILTELLQSLDLIRRYSISCSSTIQRLLDFARGASELPQKKIIDVGFIISDTVSFLEPQFKLSGIGVVRTFSKRPLKILGDFVRLQQMFMNVLLNASEATQRGGTITVATSQEPECIRIDVTDNGCGISPENLPRVFDPFFTNKRPGTSTGLGLSVVYSIVKEHGGTVSMKSEVGKGTTVTIELPLANE